MTTDVQSGLTGALLAQLFAYPAGAASTEGCDPAQPGGSDPASAAFEYAMAHIDVIEQVAFMATLDYPEHAHEFVAFSEAVAALPLAEREELYIQTFDFSPAHALEVGWHLFGESYKRGAFLVKMRDALKVAEIDEGGQLPDHLTLLLRMLDTLSSEDAEALIAECILPALKRLCAVFENKPNAYGHALRGLRGVLGEHAECVELESIAKGEITLAEEAEGGCHA